MPTDSPIMTVVVDELEKIKKLADKAIAQLGDEHLHVAIDSESNSVAVIMRHMAGNMRSRWVDFLTSDGEKPDRMRDQEFEETDASREALLAEWEHGWRCVFDAVRPLTDADLQRTVVVRSEPHSVYPGDQPADCALRGAHLPDPVPGQAPARPRLEDVVDPTRPVRRIQSADAGEAPEPGATLVVLR